LFFNRAKMEGYEFVINIIGYFKEKLMKKGGKRSVFWKIFGRASGVVFLLTRIIIVAGFWLSHEESLMMEKLTI